MVNIPQEKFSMFTMQMDIFENVLLNSESPKMIGNYLTKMLIELIGGSFVALYRSLNNIDYDLLTVYPERKINIAKSEEVYNIILKNTNKYFFEKETPKKENEVVDNAVTIPLIIKNKNIGLLFIANISEKDKAEVVIEALQKMSVFIAQVLNNSLIYQEQEKIIEQRTKEIINREILYNLTTEAIPIGIFRTDIGENITYINKEWKAIMEFKEKINLKESNIKENIKEIFNALKYSAHNKKLEIEYFIDENIPEKLECDEEKIKKILINIVGNAIKFTEKGYINLEIKKIYEEENDIEIEFSVKDTGIGMSREVSENMFQPFYQGDLSYTKKYQGIGLGLRIVKNLVELMGGNIGYETEEGKGTRIFFRLKMKKIKEKSTFFKDEKEEILKNKIEDKRKKIIIAEDNYINMLVAIKMVEKIGDYNIYKANNGEEAIKIYEKENIDLIFMDIQMPIINGYEAFEKIEKISKETGKIMPVIVAMTAYAMNHDRDKFLNAGMDYYLAKPFKIEDIKTILEKSL